MWISIPVNGGSKFWGLSMLLCFREFRVYGSCCCSAQSPEPISTSGSMTTVWKCFCQLVGIASDSAHARKFFRAKGDETSQQGKSVSGAKATTVTRNPRNECPRSLPQSWALDHQERQRESTSTGASQNHAPPPDPCEFRAGAECGRFLTRLRARVDGGTLAPLQTICLPLHWQERPDKLFHVLQRALDKLVLSFGEPDATQCRPPVRNDCGESRPV